MLTRLRQVAADLGLPFGDRRMTFNSRMAQELGKWAEEQGRGDAYHNAVFRAYFQHARNIARPAVLLDICTSVGLEAAAARDVLARRTHREAVDRDWERSRQMGITAVPTFRCGARQLVGAQTVQELSALVRSAGGIGSPTTIDPITRHSHPKGK
jgi:predicted DsbA family dithiol-disulfide isomerase